MAHIVGGLLDNISKVQEKAEGGTFDRTTDSNEAIREKLDTLPSSLSESAVYAADRAITTGDLVGVTSAGKATKLTPDWAPQSVPTSFTTIATGASATTKSHSCWIDTGDGTKFITVYNNNGDIFLVVSTVDANGTPSPGTPVDTTYNAVDNTKTVRIVKLDTNKAQIYFRSATNNWLRTFIVTVSGTVPTASAETNVADNMEIIDAIQLGTDKCCVAYNNGGNHTINGCTVSGTTPTMGTPANAGNTTSTGTGQVSIAKVATDLVAWFYEKDATTIRVANVSFSGANPTRNGTDATILTAAALADADGELTSCSTAANVACVATVNSSGNLVYIGTVTVSGTSSPVPGVNTNITFEPNPATAVTLVSLQVLDSTHVAVLCNSNALTFMGVIEIISVDIVRMLYVGKVAAGAVTANIMTLLSWGTGGKSLEIGCTSNVIKSRPYTIYHKGLSTYTDIIPVPCYGFLGVALANISDAATGSIGLKGTFTGYASGLNPLKKYVRGANEFTFLKTVNKDYSFGEVLANVMSATAIEILIPPGNSIDTSEYMAFEYQPSLSGNGPWLALGTMVLDTWTAWTSYLVAGSMDRFIEGISILRDTSLVKATTSGCLDVVQVGYGLTTVNVTLIISVPCGSSNYQSSDVGNTLIPAITTSFQRKRIPAGQTVYMRICRYAGAVTTEGVKAALTISQLS